MLQQKIGHRGCAALLGALLTIPVGPLLLFTSMPPLIGTVWIGITFTITAVQARFSLCYHSKIIGHVIGHMFIS